MPTRQEYKNTITQLWDALHESEAELAEAREEIEDLTFHLTELAASLVEVLTGEELPAPVLDGPDSLEGSDLETKLLRDLLEQEGFVLTPDEATFPVEFVISRNDPIGGVAT